MSRPIFSTRFFAIQGLAGTSSSLTVPAGEVWVVKQLTFYTAPSFGIVRGFFHDVGSGAALFSAAATTGDPGWFGFYGALVFEEGETMNWHVDAFATDAADVYAGGYVLTS